jgi:hypothetical protein
MGGVFLWEEHVKGWGMIERLMEERKANVGLRLIRKVEFRIEIQN